MEGDQSGFRGPGRRIAGREPRRGYWKQTGRNPSPADERGPVSSVGRGDRPIPAAADRQVAEVKRKILELGLLLPAVVPGIDRVEPGSISAPHRCGGRQTSGGGPGAGGHPHQSVPGCRERAASCVRRPLAGLGRRGRGRVAGGACRESQSPGRGRPRRRLDTRDVGRPAPADPAPASGRPDPGGGGVPGSGAGADRPQEHLVGKPQGPDEQPDTPGVHLPAGLLHGAPLARLRGAEGPGGARLLFPQPVRPRRPGHAPWRRGTRRGRFGRPLHRRTGFAGAGDAGQRLLRTAGARLAGARLPQRLGPPRGIRGRRDRESDRAPRTAGGGLPGSGGSRPSAASRRAHGRGLRQAGDSALGQRPVRVPEGSPALRTIADSRPGPVGCQRLRRGPPVLRPGAGSAAVGSG